MITIIITIIFNRNYNRQGLSCDGDWDYKKGMNQIIAVDILLNVVTTSNPPSAVVNHRIIDKILKLLRSSSVVLVPNL